MAYSKLLADGIIQGLELLGAKIVKIDDTHVFLEFKKGSEIDDSEVLMNTKEVFFNLYKKGLKIKRI